MGAYAFLVCDETREYLFLGRAIHGNAEMSDTITSFYIGSIAPREPFEDVELCRVLWTFLAVTARRRLQVRVDYSDDTSGLVEYSQIGGDEPGDISYAEYVRRHPWDGVRD